MDEERPQENVVRFLKGWRHSTHSDKICNEVKLLLEKTPTKIIRHRKQPHHQERYQD